MINTIKKFFKLLGTVSRVKLDRCSREIKVFDLVSTIPNPEPKDVYLVYSFDGTNIYMLKWWRYCKGNRFDADKDKQVVFSCWQAADLYKIDNISADPGVVLTHLSDIELNTFAVRLFYAFQNSIPLMGVFDDKNDGHKMLIGDMRGDVATGTSVVYDLTMAPTAGILHKHQIAHVVKTKILVTEQSIRPISVEDLKAIVNLPYRKEVIDDIATKIIKSIRNVEAKSDKDYILYAKGFTKCTTVPNDKKKIEVDDKVSA